MLSQAMVVCAPGWLISSALGKAAAHEKRPAARGFVGKPAADHEILGHRQLGEDSGVLRRITDAAPGALMRREFGDVLAAEANPTGAHRQEAGDTLDDGGASGAIASDQRNHLGVADLKRHAAQDVRRPAKGVYSFNLEQHVLVLRLPRAERAFRL